MYLLSRFFASLLLLLSPLSLGCAPGPSDLPSGSVHTTVRAGNASLYGRVVVHRPSPLMPGGVDVISVSGAQVMLYRPRFEGAIPPGTYQCQFEGFLIGDQIGDYLLGSGWIELRDEGARHRGRLNAAIPQPPPLTDYTGRFVFTGLRPGRYTLEIAAKNHRHRFIEFTLPDSSVTRTFLTEETFLDLLPEYAVER